MDLNKLQNTTIDDLTFCVVDTETTGMYAEFNRIMDIGIVKVKNGKIIEKWETLINPEQDVPYWITKYTNLTNNDVANKLTFKNYCEKIINILSNSIFVAHNVGFDYWFLHHELKRHGYKFSMPKLCTVKLSRRLLPHLYYANLDALSEYYSIQIQNRHRALPDAEATAIILNNFLGIAKEKYGANTFFDLEKLQKYKTKYIIDSSLAQKRLGL